LTRVTFLPIVERELRVAARRPMTFWLRIVAALVAFVIASGLFTLFVSIPSGIGTQPGGPLFAVLTWMSLAVTLAAGLFFTSDVLSEEKREGKSEGGLGARFARNSFAGPRSSFRFADARFRKPGAKRAST